MVSHARRGHIYIWFVKGNQCRECAKINLKASRGRRREEYLQWERQYRDSRREILRENERKRYARNPDKFRQKTRTYYRKNCDDVKRKRRVFHHASYKDPLVRKRAAERVRIWVEENPIRAKINGRVSHLRRRARATAAQGSSTSDDLKDIFKLQKGRCAYCRIKLGSKHHLDHIIPVSKGGSNFRKNLQFLCAPCNLRKAASDPEDHARKIGLLI